MTGAVPRAAVEAGRGRRVAACLQPVLRIGAAVALLGCAACQNPAADLPAREAPSASGPFANVGYRNLKAEPIPGTEIPNGELAALQGCAGSAEKREAYVWLRDWFAAGSKLDHCDHDAQAVLAGAKVRQGLVYILDKLTGGQDIAKECHDAGLRLFTLIEERHSMLGTWRNVTKTSCSFDRKKEVAAKREAEFMLSLQKTVDGIGQFRGR